MISLKTQEEIEIMKKAGKTLSGIMDKLSRHIKPGITTEKIDDIAAKLVEQENATPAFKGYKGFPANICISVDEEVVHGIPRSDCVLKEGDIVSIDIGIKLDAHFADMAVTFPVGKISAKKKKLVDITKKALKLGISKARVNNRLSDISFAIQSCVESAGFSIVRQFVGHGIGRFLHEEPEIPNFGKPHQGPVLKPGMVFAIEPMVNMGGFEVETQENGWTAVTKDRLPSAHFEHTVAVSSNGPVILTH